MYLAAVTSFPVGMLAGATVSALVAGWLYRRAAAEHRAAIERHRRAIDDMRQERAGDREVNRQLRRELAINTPENLREERDRALLELDKLNSELLETTLELENRDRSLRDARQAIHEIRVQLEHNRTVAAEAGRSGRTVERHGEQQPAEQLAEQPALEPPAQDTTAAPDTPVATVAAWGLGPELVDSDDRETTSS